MVGSKKRKAYKLAVLAEQDWFCKYCFEPLSWETATLDHVCPVGRKKRRNKMSATRGNAVAACALCNEAKDSMDMHEFVHRIASEQRPEERNLALVWEKRRERSLGEW